MSRMEHNVDFEQSVEVVFAYLANPEAYPQWQSGYLEAQITSEGPIGVGTRFRAVNELAGRRIEVQNEVTAYVPDRKFAFKSISGNLEVRSDVRLQSFRGGTKANLVFEAQLGSFLRLPEPLAAWLIRQRQQADLEELKKLLVDATGGNAKVHE
jgi:uncharacterized protein YndB with AHSA1/START domain